MILKKEEIKHTYMFSPRMTHSGYGLDVYAYSLIFSDTHPDDENAQEIYDRLYGELFKECPGLKGVILVGEVVGFKSKDERTYHRKLYDLPHPGFFRAEIIPHGLTA